MEPRWYVIEAFEGRDGDAVLKLLRAGFEVWRPFEIIRQADRRSSAGAKRSPKKPRQERRKPRFGRYFFMRCALSDDLFHEISHTANIRGFLCSRGTRRPFPIPDEQIAFLKDNAADRPTPGWQADFYKGRRVTIAAGPFAGKTGLVATIDKRGILKVDLENRFGSPIPLIVEVGHVEAAALAKPPNASNENSSARPDSNQGTGA